MASTGSESAGDDAHLAPPGPDLPFVGRETALATLVAAVRAAELGDGVLALVAGEPGIGKTRLAQEMAARVAARVLWATSWDDEGAPAYWRWLQLLRALRDAPGELATRELELVDRVDVLAGAPPYQPGGGARWEMFDTVAAALAQASQRQPLVLVLEDLHGVDEASVRLLES